MWSFTPTKRGGGAEKVLAVLKGGHNMFWGSFYVVAWSLSYIELEGGGGGGGGRKRFPLIKRGGGVKSFTLWRDGVSDLLCMAYFLFYEMYNLLQENVLNIPVFLSWNKN